MTYESICISAGHGKYVRGASGNPGLDEVDEARRVMSRLAEELRARSVTVATYADDVSKSQDENLRRICDWHNSKTRQVDCSIHFNAYQQTSKAMGTECLYVTQEDLSAKIAAAIASQGFINRGAKYRSDLFVLNNTEAPCVLLEVCFVDSDADVALYRQKFDGICRSIADVLGGPAQGVHPPERPDRPPVTTPPPSSLFEARGRCSWFGGPEDMGVSPSEGLAFIYDIETVPHLFLPYQPPGTTGLARRLNPYVHYIACRWDYNITPKKMLAESGEVAVVRAVKTGMELRAIPADWGPHEAETGRAADLSPSLLEDLGLATDDEVEVVYPAP